MLAASLQCHNRIVRMYYTYYIRAHLSIKFLLHALKDFLCCSDYKLHFSNLCCCCCCLRISKHVPNFVLSPGVQTGEPRTSSLAKRVWTFSYWDHAKNARGKTRKVFVCGWGSCKILHIRILSSKMVELRVIYIFFLWYIRFSCLFMEKSAGAPPPPWTPAVGGKRREREM